MIRLQEMIRFYVGYHRIPLGDLSKEIGVANDTLRQFIIGGRGVEDDTLLKIFDWCIQVIPDNELKGIVKSETRVEAMKERHKKARAAKLAQVAKEFEEPGTL